MVFPTCSSVSPSTGIGTGCKINIVYNQQKPLCASTSGAPGRGQQARCRPPDELCSSDPDFRFDLETVLSFSPGVKKPPHVDLSDSCVPIGHAFI